MRGGPGVLTKDDESEPEQPVSKERLKVLRWRREELVRAGLTPQQADVLAAMTCDLHEALELLKAGCPPDIAFDILRDYIPDGEGGTPASKTAVDSR